MRSTWLLPCTHQTRRPGRQSPAPHPACRRGGPNPRACLRLSPPQTRSTTSPSSPRTYAQPGRSGSYQCSASPPRDLLKDRDVRGILAAPHWQKALTLKTPSYWERMEGAFLSCHLVHKKNHSANVSTDSWGGNWWQLSGYSGTTAFQRITNSVFQVIMPAAIVPK